LDQALDANENKYWWWRASTNDVSLSALRGSGGGGENNRRETRGKAGLRIHEKDNEDNIIKMANNYHWPHFSC